MLFSGGAFLHFRAKAMTSWQARATVCESGRQVARYALRVPYAGVIAGRSVLQSCSSSPTSVTSPSMRSSQAVRPYSGGAETSAAFAGLSVLPRKDCVGRLSMLATVSVRSWQSMASRSVSI
jgi:hypothetical protein